MLNIYKASAGSGKTHTLTRNFLFLSFENPYKFKNILAVTFTNKAAGEMKERIIDELYTLSSSPENSVFLDEIKTSFKLTSSQIQQKAKKNLSTILHNYSFLNISTIDSFVQRVIKAFAFELRAPSSYIVEMDTNKVAKSITDELLQKLDNDKLLKKWLISFAFNKIDDGQKWDFRESVTDFAKQLFSEKFYTVFNNFTFSQDEFIERIDNLNKQCSSLITNYTKNIKLLQEKGLSLINSSGILEVKSSKIKDLYNYFLKKILVFEIEPGKRLSEGIFDNKWWPNKTKDEEKIQWENTLVELTHIVKEIIEFDKKNASDYYSAKIIKKNIYNLGIINYLYSLLPEYRQKNNALLISDLTLFLKKIIGNDNNDAPFIYEKIGNKFQNIMIDEFQDTSDFQWQNFKPLVSDSLANGFFNLIVGDVKQSIYRWRNGDWRLLHSKIKQDLTIFNIDEISLDTNWRSNKEIVLFNNTIFSILPKILQEKAENLAVDINLPEDLQNIIPNIYNDIVQKISPNKTKDGYIELKFFDKQNWKETVNEELPRQIDNLLNYYSPGDIGILVRTNKQADDIMQVLLDYIADLPESKKFNVISAESLLLENSLAVRLIINVLKLIQKPNETILGIEIAINYLKLKEISINNHELFSIKEFDELKKFIPEEFIALFPKLSHYSLFELIEKIISIFELNIFHTEIPFIRSLQEHVSTFIQKQTADFASFLDFWDEKSSTLSVQLSEIKDAVQIMTVHKSKGLAFEIVIVPYLDWDLNPNNAILWTETKETPFTDIPYLPLNITKDLIKSHFSKDYFYELFYNYIDTLNVLYVAFTRAKQRIYSNLKIAKTKNAQSSKLPSQIFELLKGEFLPDNDLIINPQAFFDTNENIFKLGNPEFPVDKNVQEIDSKDFKLNYYPSHDWTDSIAIIAHAEDFIAETVDTRRNAIKHGILMHSVFEKLKTFDDVDSVLDKMIKDRKLNSKDAIEIKQNIDKLFEIKTVRNWFTYEWEIFAEKEILTRFGDTKIPDRVIAKENQLVVIDYKFGEKRSEHKSQVRNYMRLLKDIYPNKLIKGYILYVENTEIIEILNSSLEI